jgi:DNA replication protein DnaC
MDNTLVLDTYLKQLRLPMCMRNYRKVAEEAAQANLGYDRFLLALAEQEVAPREQNRQAQLIRTARFPALKELATFDVACLPQLPKPQVLELARADSIQKVEPMLMVGNPGLGKTHLATALALAACRQGYKVRFYTAAGLVNELIQAQDDHRLPRVLAAALKQHLIVVDELGFIPFSPPGRI